MAKAFVKIVGFSLDEYERILKRPMDVDLIQKKNKIP